MENGQTNGTEHPLRVCVFDNMRVRSHIFSRLFSQHSQLKQIYHPYLMPSFLGPARIQVHFDHPPRRRREIEVDWQPLYVKETYGACRTVFEREAHEIEATGRSVWVSEHSALAMRQDICLTSNRGHKYTPEDLGANPTYYPDWFFDTCTPILVIRHPVFSVPSLYDVMSTISFNLPGSEDFHFCTTLHYCRLLFDLFQSQGRNPIVVDGDDVLWRREEMTDSVCKALGIDPSEVKEQWNPTPEEDRPKHPILAAFTKTIHEASGVERPAKKPPRPLGVAEEKRKIVEKYGEQVGNQLIRYVDLNIEDYEHMSAFKV